MDQKAIEAEVKNYKIREGPLYKRSKFLKEWRERWVVVTMNYLFTFTSKNLQQVTDIIDLKHIKSYKSYLRKDEEMIQVGFKIRTQQDEYYFCAKSPLEKWSWIVTFQRLLDYKHVGASNYNNVDWIKSKGFESQLQFQKGGSGGTFDPNAIQKQSSKKDVDGEAQRIMKQLQKQQQEFKKKQQQLKQKEATFILQQQKKLKQLQLKKVQEKKPQPPKNQQKPKPQTDNTESYVAKLKNIYEQKMTQSSKQTVPSYKLEDKSKKQPIKKDHNLLHLSRAKVVAGLFDQLDNNSQSSIGFHLFIDFLVRVGADKVLGYNSFVVYQSKTHQHRKNFAQAFIQLIIDYKDYKNCLPYVNFIEICIFQSSELFNGQQKRQIKKKLLQFLLNVNQQDKLEYILKDMFVLHKLQKYQKSHQLNQKLDKLVKESKKEQTRNWARKLKEDL